MLLENLENTEDIITSELQIKERLKELADRTSDTTVQDKMSLFKHLLYFSLFLGFENYYMFNQLTPPDYKMDGDFSVILRLWYQYLCEHKYLKLTFPSTAYYYANMPLSNLRIENCSLNGYKQTSFEWAIPQNEQDLFLYILMAITSSYTCYRKSPYFNASDFFGLVPSYINKRKKKYPQTASFCERLLKQYNLIADYCLEKNYLCTLNQFYKIFPLKKFTKTQKNTVYSSVRNLTAILMSQKNKHTPYISEYIERILDNYIKNLVAELPKGKKDYSQFFHHYEPHIVFEFELKTMGLFFTNIESAKKKCLNTISQIVPQELFTARTYRISTEKYSLLEKHIETFINQVSLESSSCKQKLKECYCGLANVAITQTSDIFLDAIPIHETQFNRQIDNYCSKLTQSFTRFKKSIKRHSTRRPLKETEPVTLYKLKLDLEDATNAANSKFELSTTSSKARIQLPPIAQFPNDGFLNKLSYWHLPSFKINLRALIFKLIEDLNINMSADEILATTQIQDFSRMVYDNIHDRVPFTAHDMLVLLQIIHDISQNS